MQLFHAFKLPLHLIRIRHLPPIDFIAVLKQKIDVILDQVLARQDLEALSWNPDVLGFVNVDQAVDDDIEPVALVAFFNEELLRRVRLHLDVPHDSQINFIVILLKLLEKFVLTEKFSD